MLNANTGSSTNKIPKIAGCEAAKKAKVGLTDIKMAFVYASCDYDLDEMLEGIREVMPEVPFIGNTSFTGVILPEGYVSGQDGFIGMMAMADADLQVGIASVKKAKNAIEDGMEVARKAMANAGTTEAPDYFYMVAPPGEEEFYLKGITRIIGRVPFFGGSAADNSISGDWQLYTQDGAFSDGIAVAFFYTNKEMKNQFTGAYHETADRGIITKVSGDRTLVEIDGEPALEKYAKWRGVTADSLLDGNLLVATITSPLGVKDRLGDLVAIRHPMNGNVDHSMAVGSKLSEGTAVIRMEATIDELIASAGTELNNLNEKMEGVPGAYHLVHCGGRRAGIGERIEEVVTEIKNAAGEVPFIVEFTFGEYGYEADGINTCGGLMLSYTGFSK